MTPCAGLGRLAILVTALAAVVDCGPADRGAGGSADGEPSARTYRVRGVLQAPPEAATGTGQLRIRHEAIPDLIGAGGEVEGMAAMTMSFPVAEGVDLVGLAAGDRVRFDLRVDWDASHPVMVTAIDRLPAETELALD